MKIGNVSLVSPFVVAPMAGMTDTAFRRLVKRQGGCGLVVTEMVSAEGLVRGEEDVVTLEAGAQRPLRVFERVFVGAHDYGTKGQYDVWVSSTA